MQSYFQAKLCSFQIQNRPVRRENWRGPGYCGNHTLVRKKTPIGVEQAVAQFTTRAGRSPGLGAARRWWKRAKFSWQPAEATAGLGAPGMGGLAGG